MKTFLLLLGAVLLGIIQASFVAALPAPLDHISLPLVFIVALVTAFRLRDAYLVAVVCGLAMDALSSLPPVTSTATLLLTTFVTMLLFTRIFTHRSWLGTFGLNIVAFACSHLLLSIVGTVRAGLAGIDYSFFPNAATMPVLLAALATQAVVILLIMIVSSAFARAFTRRFFLLR